MIETFVKEALAEDVGRGDLFCRVFASEEATAKIIAKCSGVVAGERYVNALCAWQHITVVWHKGDKQLFCAGDDIATFHADSHTLLRCERTILNMLLHASSIATLTHQFVARIAKYDVTLLDTRKTRPLLRTFEKYATHIGGAINHRMGLDDCLMLKDTHIKTIDDLQAFVAQARKKIPFTAKIEIEVGSVKEANAAFNAGADIVMCDNMSIDAIKEVVLLRERVAPHVLLEASGNVSLQSIESYAQTGVDAISVGALIHQANWIDLSMKMQ